MIGALFRALFYLGPFIKEVFISSSEDKRIWISRFFMTLAIVLVVAYLGVRHVIVEFNTLERENHALRTQIHDKDEKIKTWASRYEVLQSIIQGKDKTIDGMLDQTKQLQKENRELRDTLSAVKEKPPERTPSAPSHSLPSSKPVAKTTPPTKQTHSPKKHTDRLGDLD